jgi:hypothetical protein
VLVLHILAHPALHLTLRRQITLPSRGFLSGRNFGGSYFGCLFFFFLFPVPLALPNSTEVTCDIVWG